MAPDEAVTLTDCVKISALHPPDSSGDDRLSHTPVLHLSAGPSGEALAPLPSRSNDDDGFPSALAPVHDLRLFAVSSERQKKVENFPPRRPLKLAPIELPLEVKEAQRQNIRSIWKEAENLGPGVRKVSSHGKALLLPVNQIIAGQRSVKKEPHCQALGAIYSSPDPFQNTTSSQSECREMNISQSKGCKKAHPKLRRVRQLDKDQSKSDFSTEGLKDTKGKPVASGATARQRDMDKVLEKSSSGNPLGKVSETVAGRGSRRMAVYRIQEAAL